jgi:hypothetical protein
VSNDKREQSSPSPGPEAGPTPILASPLRGAAAALVELDRELMKLLVRRATLVSRIRGGKEHAATPAAIRAEKAVRIAWENGAIAFSKDPRFSRRLFTLLQDIQVLSKEQAEHAAGFTLFPAAGPVAGTITGPAATRAVQMNIFLAACLGRPLHLDKIFFSTALLDALHACSQAGGRLSHTEQGPEPGRVDIEEGAPLTFPARTIFVGQDLYTLYGLAFLAVGQTGSCRFTGGAGLKEADLTPLRQTLPLFGARLSHVVPHSRGLPANLECSGQIPSEVMVPPDLPLTGLCALLPAPLVWRRPLTLDLASLPAAAAAAALAEVRPLLLAAGAAVEMQGSRLVYPEVGPELGPELGPEAGPEVGPEVGQEARQAVRAKLPEQPVPPLDPVLSAYLLALPAFAGGSLTLTGLWPPDAPDTRETSRLLDWAGVMLSHDEKSVTATAADEAFCRPCPCEDVPSNLGPLYLALLARRHALTGESGLPPASPFPLQDEDTSLAGDFFFRLGLVYRRDALVRSPDAAPHPARGKDGEKTAARPGHSGAGRPPARRIDAPDRSPGWTSPDAFWGMAYALAAFVRPGLKLANPGIVTETLPSFWKLYNSLPRLADPVRPRQEKKQEATADRPAKPARRRVLADRQF